MAGPADNGGGRRARLESARLYLICGASPGGRVLNEMIAAAAAGGVDVFQLREKELDDHALLALARETGAACRATGLLFIVNDRPDIAAAVNADGVHLGQSDMPVHRARRVVGPERLVGLSTHSPDHVDAARGVDYIGVGPVHATPTKPGRPAAGLDLVRHAAAHATVPFFAIGGIDATNVDQVVAAGATRVAVVRAIAEADDPEHAARLLADAVDKEARVGST